MNSVTVDAMAICVDHNQTALGLHCFAQIGLSRLLLSLQ